MLAAFRNVIPCLRMLARSFAGFQSKLYRKASPRCAQYITSCKTFNLRQTRPSNSQYELCHCETAFFRRSNPLFRRGDCFAKCARNDIMRIAELSPKFHALENPHPRHLWSCNLVVMSSGVRCSYDHEIARLLNYSTKGLALAFPINANTIFNVLAEQGRIIP